MKVKKEHVPGDPSGDAGPCYIYEFSANNEIMFGRQWCRDMRSGELIHWRDRNRGFQRFFTVPYEQDTFRRAVRYFIDEENVCHVYVMVFQKNKKGSPEFHDVVISKILA
jgi:hypothetical protein